MQNPKVLPFYMTYPLPMGYAEDKDMVRDLEYFQQLYPWGAKILQKEIVKMIDILDYTGSMIYDEYPDQMRIRQMAKTILQKAKKGAGDENEDYRRLLDSENIEDYALLLLMYEILRRRHKSDRGYLTF